MAITRKGLTYLLLAYSFIGLAVVFREPALMGFVIPSAILLLFSSRVPQSSNLRIVRRVHPLRSFGDESIEVTVEVHNDSGNAVNEVRLEDRIPESLVLEAGTKTLTMYLRPRERTEFGYRVLAPKRGNYVLGPAHLRVSDIMGFHEYETEMAIMDEFTVMPRVEKLGPIALRARRVQQWPGLVSSRRIGSGTEFFELRPYQAGDDLRRVNWKASARLSNLVTNEFEGEQVTDVLIIVDVSEAALSKLFDFDVAEFELSLAASLCSQLISQGNRVGLSVYSAVRTWVDPGFGKRQLLRLLNSLAIAEAGRASIPLQYGVESVIVSMVAARSVLIFISPLLDDETIEVVVNLATRGYGVICFTPTVASNVEERTLSRILARRILTSERRIKMAEVAEVARLIEFAPQLDLRHELRRWGPRKRV
jgi:uncharacterized repeat protein (TIGR01451 family)